MKPQDMSGKTVRVQEHAYLSLFMYIYIYIYISRERNTRKKNTRDYSPYVPAKQTEMQTNRQALGRVQTREKTNIQQLSSEQLLWTTASQVKSLSAHACLK